MQEKGSVFQTKRSETDFNEVQISDLLNREFKITVIKMLTKVSRTMHEQSENFNKETEDIGKHQKNQRGKEHKPN